MEKAKHPLLTLTFEVSLPVYTECVLMLGGRLKTKNMPRFLVMGAFMTVGAVAALVYLNLHLGGGDSRLNALAGALLLLGICNLVYYPVYFERLLTHRAQKNYDESPYLNKPVTLRFYREYFDEETGEETNRVQWASVLAVHREQLYYLLRLTRDSGVIIPRTEVNAEQAKVLEEILAQVPLR